MSVIPYVKNPPWADSPGGGTPLSAAKLNIIEQGITDAHLQPAVRVFHNANQSISTATFTVLAFNSERYDQVGAASTMHDTTTNNSRLTARHGGVYSITGNVEFAINSVGVRLVRIRLNGETVIARNTPRNAGAADFTMVNVSTDHPVAVNDYVELMVYQSSGGTLNVNYAPNYSPEFMMARVA